MTSQSLGLGRALNGKKQLNKPSKVKNAKRKQDPARKPKK